MPISSKMTPRSVSTSPSSNLERKNISHRMSAAWGRWVSSTRAWKQVHSLVVKALTWPPMASISSASRAAERVAVPLKSICSIKWAAPPSPGCSWREPVPTQMPRQAERTPGTCSVRIRTPLGSVRFS